MTILDILQKEEGFEDMPYFDHLGILTVGYGRNLIANPWTLAESKEWAFASKQKRLAIGKEFLNDRIVGLDIILNNTLPWYKKLGEARIAFMILMAYQLGIEGTLKFKNTLKLIEKKDYDNAMLALLDSKWAKQTPRRALRMAHLLQTGDLENYFN